MIDATAPAPGQPALGNHTHFTGLDGLRGIAACCVFLFHGLASPALHHPLFVNGLLMVDLFFMLSGFVVAHAYEKPLMQGMALSDFTIRRIVRLYPMIFLGALLAGSVAIFDHFFRQNSPLALDAGDLATAIALSFVLLPFTWGNPTPEIFPTNTVLWSLMFEMAINIVYAALARHLTTGRLAVIVAASLIAIVVGGLGGGGTDNAWMGIPRVSAGFFGGVILYRLWRDGSVRLRPIGFSTAALLLVLISTVPWPLPASAHPLMLLLFAGIILATADHRAGKRTARICVLLGSISYPLYVLHRPILSTMLSLARRIGGADGPILLATVAVALLVCTIVSHQVVRFYEGPARRMLGRRLRIGRTDPRDPETVQSRR